MNSRPTIITATNRLARELQQRHDQRQLEKGLTAWPSLDSVSWNAWIKRLWNEQRPMPARLLSTIEQQQLWAEVIERDVARQDSNTDSELAPLWNFQSTAKQAILAWQLHKLWDINLDRCRFSNQPDHRSFARWAEQYGATLSQQNWIDEASLVCHLSQQPPNISGAIELVGFEDLSPAQTRLLDTLKAQGTAIQHTKPAKNNPKTTQQHTYTDPQTEWRHIGAWARTILENRPQARIGVVTPELEANRNLVISSLNEQLIPGLIPGQCSLPENHSRAAFHLSVGLPLAKQPLVWAALDLLELITPVKFAKVDFERISAALTSPFAFTQTNPTLRFALELNMRRRVAQRLDIYDCLQAVNQNNPTLPALKKSLSSLQNISKSAPQTQSYSQWAQYFSDWLQQAQWPGTELNSAEYQTLEAWRNSLHQLSQLDHLGKQISLLQARSDLNRLCQQNQFQPQADTDAPIQVLGMLEASSMQFDHLWVAGLHENAWPSNAQANPFIPISEQRNAGWPAADPQRHFDLAKLRLAQFCAAAPEVHFSYATTVEGVAVAPSPLLAGLSVITSKVPQSRDNHVAASPLNWNQQLCDTQLDTVSDQQAPAISTAELAHGLSSGISRIQAQAACPFRAFASYRLNAEFEAEPELGTDALDRGLLAHAVLADFWVITQTQSALIHQIEQHQLSDKLQTIIDKHLAKALRHSGMGEAFARAEGLRVNQLIQDWLRVELDRAPFTVLAQEQEMQARVGGLACSFRIDRIDEIQSGKTTVIDYKTGLANPNEWCGDRLDSPQLPYYALAVSQQIKPVEAVLFGQVRAGEHQYSGIAENADLVQGIRPPEELSGTTMVKQDLKTWAEVLPTWQQRIEQLATQHLRGEAQVDPKKPTTCLYCELDSLCRIEQPIQTGGPAK